MGSPVSVNLFGGQQPVNAFVSLTQSSFFSLAFSPPSVARILEFITDSQLSLYVIPMVLAITGPVSLTTLYHRFIPVWNHFSLSIHLVHTPSYHSRISSWKIAHLCYFPYNVNCFFIYFTLLQGMMLLCNVQSAWSFHYLVKFMKSK